MLQMRVFVPQERAPEVGRLLQAIDGARHVVIVGPTFDGAKTLITAELTPAMTDQVMRQLVHAGVSSDEIDVLQSDTVPTIEAGVRGSRLGAKRSCGAPSSIRRGRMRASAPSTRSSWPSPESSPHSG